MNENEDEEIADLFAPWDARAWDNLRQSHGDTAERLAALIAAGVAPQTIRRHAEEHGYSLKVAGWLEQAALHIQRQRADPADEPEPIPPGATG
jgi:hypothetical protein